MPKRKRRDSGSSGSAGRMRQWEPWERRELLAEFELWLSERHAIEPDVVGTLLELKADELDSPDPALWTEEMTVGLLTEVVPRAIIQSRQAAMDLVPSLVRFFAFLTDRDRWSEGSMSPQAAAALTAGLEFAVLEAVEDPTRRSFSTNILTYGVEHGVDPDDEDALAAYMEWYNTLPHAHRVELSDTGRISDPQVVYDPEQAPRVVGGMRGSPFLGRTGGTEDAPHGSPGADWPWFLPDVDLDLEALRGWDPHRHLADYRDNVLVQRARILLETVGEGLPVTATGALRRADIAIVLERFGLDRTARSMWDVPEITHAWAALHDGSWLMTAGSRVVPGSGPAAPASPEEDPEAFIDFAHALLLSLLGSMWARSGSEGGLAGMPDTLTTLLYVCREGGLRIYDLTREGVPEVPLDPRTGEQDVEELARYVQVRRDLGSLTEAGVIHRSGTHVRGTGAVLIAVIAMIEIMQEMGEGPR